MKEVPLRGGRVAQVDDSDFEFLSNHGPWRNANGYAMNKDRMKMEWLLLERPYGCVVDHRDGNPLNNQRSNLRVCTIKENHQHQVKNKANTSGFRGVCFHYKTGKWLATIRVDYKQKHLGLFLSPKEAAVAYDRAAKKAFDEFAQLNFSNG